MYYIPIGVSSYTKDFDYLYMPLPKPKSNENENTYISRCMEAQKDEDKPQDQKLAICYSKWEESVSMTRIDDMFQSNETPTFDWERQYLTEAAQYRYYEDDIDRRTFDRLVALNPKLSRWIVEKYIDYLKREEEGRAKMPERFAMKGMLDEDYEQWQEYFADFQKMKRLNIWPNHLKDIFKIKRLVDFKFIVIQNRPDLEDAEEQERLGDGEAEKVYDKSGWLIVIPKDEAASCKYGANTEWCTAATRTSNYFDRYNEKGELYIIIDKKNDRKWQFHPGTDSYMDANDSPISLGEYLTAFPPHVIKFCLDEGISPFEEKIIDKFYGLITNVTAMDQAQWIEKYRSSFEGVEDSAWEALLDIIKLDEPYSYIATKEMEWKLQDELWELMLTNGDDNGYSYGYENPDEFLDEEPEDEDEEGEPEWSEDQRIEAAQQAEQQSIDFALEEKMREILSSPISGRTDYIRSITDILNDHELWDFDVFMVEIQDILLEGGTWVNRLFDEFENYGIV